MLSADCVCMGKLQLQTRAEGRMANVNYGVQLLEFFELYGMNFNYSRAGISVVDGGKYVQKERDSQGQMSLYIQDPACEGLYLLLIK